MAAIAGVLVVPAVGTGEGLFVTPSQFLGTLTQEFEDLCASTRRPPLTGPKTGGLREEDPWARYWPYGASAPPSWPVADRCARHAVEELKAWEASGLIAQNDASNDFMSIRATNTDEEGVSGGGVGLCFRW
jgi:hypothetical protein